MCITLFSTAHKDYALILANNRDEFLVRPTQRTHWWSDDAEKTKILAPRDLQRPERGTWLGISSSGKIANVTNFREKGEMILKGKSRGALVKEFLTFPHGKEEFATHLVNEIGVVDFGGFTLLFGDSMTSGSFDIISNRTESPDEVVDVARGQTRAFSNSLFGDATWPKVVKGEEMLGEIVGKDWERDELVQELFATLSTDTLPRHPKHDEDFQSWAFELRKSIFIPPVDAGQGNHYGTQTQIVLLVGRNGEVTFVERMLYQDGKPVPERERESSFQFTIKDG
ncbi:DUF833-domain-containing protein [Piedraia hortae CBS 480.64]|uniref:DUF833-domain-containing protein n=1 Tax=Piedraia hortae CBS 480.64 TaxID=1314780 RepID=A0A6A7C9C9_9PEZI|nr:DUF833-domain-containing protein [Piedraia hortae CBS 480.64]